MKLRRATLVVKALIVTGAVAATTVGLAAPAWAGQNVSAPWDLSEHLGGRQPTTVYGAFHHSGDWLQLVDSCRNNSWIGYLQVRNGAEMTTYHVAKKGTPHRCGERWINRDFREGRDIGIRACLAIPADWDTCSPWRWGIA